MRMIPHRGDDDPGVTDAAMRMLKTSTHQRVHEDILKSVIEETS
jgi:hypothetical protein